MKTRVVGGLIAALVAFGIAGCGGGGGQKLSHDPVAEVKAQEKALRVVMDQKDLVAFMGFYSDRFKDNDGMTKPEMRMLLFENQENLDFTQAERVDSQYVVSGGGRRVQEYFVLVYHYTYTDSETGQEETYTQRYSGQADWVVEGSTWRIIYERQAMTAMALAAKRKH
jgi:hypothetical protein